MHKRQDRDQWDFLPWLSQRESGKMEENKNDNSNTDGCPGTRLLEQNILVKILNSLFWRVTKNPKESTFQIITFDGLIF